MLKWWHDQRAQLFKRHSIAGQKTFQTWSPAFYSKLSDADKLEFPARMVEGTDLPIKAITTGVYSRILCAIDTKSSLEGLAIELNTAHGERLVLSINGLSFTNSDAVMESTV